MTRLCSGKRAALAVAVLGLMGAAAATRSSAQGDPHALEPQVVASGSAEVLIPATKASFSIEITSLAPTAAAAGAESARRAKAVSSALQAAGLSRDEMTESRLTVSPRWEYDQATRKERRTGYQATTTIEIGTEHMDRLGSYIDAALNGGATGISDITFSAKDSDEARHRALAEAVARARADAEAMARAGGGALGELLLLTTQPMNNPRPVPLEMAAGAFRRSPEASETSIIPSRITVTAEVTGRWRFAPRPAPQ
jgi:uncharacterized protein